MWICLLAIKLHVNVFWYTAKQASFDKLRFNSAKYDPDRCWVRIYQKYNSYWGESKHKSHFQKAKYITRLPLRIDIYVHVHICMRKESGKFCHSCIVQCGSDGWRPADWIGGSPTHSTGGGRREESFLKLQINFIKIPVHHCVAKFCHPAGNLSLISNSFTFQNSH